jgi:hypothetical protein
MLRNCSMFVLYGASNVVDADDRNVSSSQIIHLAEIRSRQRSPGPCDVDKWHHNAVNDIDDSVAGADAHHERGTVLRPHLADGDRRSRDFLMSQSYFNGRCTRIAV